MGSGIKPRLEKAFVECGHRGEVFHGARAIHAQLAQCHQFYYELGENARLYTSGRPVARIRKLEEALDRALKRIDALEARLAGGAPEKSPQAVTEPCLAGVVEMTQQLFGVPEVSVEQDPEVPDVPMVVFTVFPKGTPHELVDKRMEWHRRMSSMLTDRPNDYRLSIIPKE
jgi:hypothetical protein